ncbi:MAG: hypothetical protein ACRDRT_11970 [Pseudonocardiaceae bacterium]
MNEQRQAITELLQSDATLKAMLAANKPWWKIGKTDPADQKWSIIPYDQYKNQVPPFITIQAGSSNQAGYKLLEDFFFIRCYNASDKTYVSITDILSRVNVLLHRHRFNFAGSSSIETLYETTGPELLDEGYGLKFREARYRLLRI